jgi:hypothetical protein
VELVGDSTVNIFLSFFSVPPPSQQDNWSSEPLSSCKPQQCLCPCLPSLVPTSSICPKAAQAHGIYTTGPIAHPAFPQFSSPVHYVRAAVVWTRYAPPCFLFHHLSIASASYSVLSLSSRTCTTIWTQTLPYRSCVRIWHCNTTLARHQVQTVCVLIRSRW